MQINVEQKQNNMAFGRQQKISSGRVRAYMHADAADSQSESSGA
jgi:hypothetical protein